jgi:hypothetical protein
MALQHRSDIETLALAIAHSPIVVARVLTQPRVRSRQSGAFAVLAGDLASGLPDGFEDVDLAILRWIADEGRRVGRTLARI